MKVYTILFPLLFTSCVTSGEYKKDKEAAASAAAASIVSAQARESASAEFALRSSEATCSIFAGQCMMAVKAQVAEGMKSDPKKWAKATPEAIQQYCQAAAGACMQFLNPQAVAPQVSPAPESEGDL